MPPFTMWQATSQSVTQKRIKLRIANSFDGRRSTD
jgi:hypothetical protein